MRHHDGTGNASRSDGRKPFAAFSLMAAFSIALTSNAIGDPAEKPQESSASNKLATPEITATEKPVILVWSEPRYLDLRYDEDFRYLDGAPDTYDPDFFDPIKNIRLDEQWRLSIGGEFRFRMEAETNLDFRTASSTQDTFQLYRYLLHFDLKYRDSFRTFLQLGVFHDEDRDLADRPFDENHLALHQLFMDFKPMGDGSTLTLRAGRQELSYEKQRLVSPLDWANTRRRFDAVKLIWKESDWQFDLFWSRPIPVNRDGFDDWNDKFNFYGAYFAYSGIARHGIDLFAFAVDDRGGRVNPNGRIGDVERYTLGSRFYGKTGGLDYEAMLAGQWGMWANDRIEAWASTLDGGYTFANAPWGPRVGAGFDWATGDRNPGDGSVETFDQMFPLGHAFLGYIDLVGRQNIRSANVNLTAWPIAKKLQTYLAFHGFWLHSPRDALYNAGGQATRRDSGGNSGREVGYELDATLLWNVSLHQAVLLGYSHLWAQDFIAGTGRSKDPHLFYLQYRFRF